MCSPHIDRVKSQTKWKKRKKKEKGALFLLSFNQLLNYGGTREVRQDVSTYGTCAFVSGLGSLTAVSQKTNN